MTQTGEPHRIQFYDLLFIEAGQGTLEVDGQSADIQRGRVLITAPGEVRRWLVRGSLMGRVLFFDDPLFVSPEATVGKEPWPRSLDLFAAGRTMSHVDPSRALFEMLMARIAVIRDELSAIRYDSRELLRSEVVSILVHLNRAYTSQHGAARRAAPVLLAERFRHLVARHWRERWSISRYADALNVSAEHLGREIQHALGRTPADVAREPFIRELERVFLYSDDTMSDVAYRFGFPDPSSLSRYVKRHTGRTPSQIRKRT